MKKSITRNGYALGVLMSMAGMFFACEESNKNEVPKNTETFVSLESPYLICANRNPGGIVFDFYYSETQGGANYADSLSVEDVEADLLLRTVKADKDGSAVSANYVALQNGAVALNYSDVDPDCVGRTAFDRLDRATVLSKTLTFLADEATFSLTDLTLGTSGNPLQKEVQAQIGKLVIGDAWKASAKNTVDGDEPIWIIQTSDNQYVKWMVQQFPAVGAPTATGYIDVVWAILSE